MVKRKAYQLLCVLALAGTAGIVGCSVEPADSSEEASIGTVEMDMRYTEAFGGEPPEAYERLLLDAMRGDPTLFSRRDAVEASWAWLQPILDCSEASPPPDLATYAPGSAGPEAAARLIARDGFAWRPLAPPG